MIFGKYLLSFRVFQTSRQDESKGAIPKRPRNNQDTKEVEIESDTKEAKEDLESKQEQWRRKALRRRPPTPPTSSHTDDHTSDLRQRILEILSTTSNEECDRQLSRLKRELESQQESPENVPTSQQTEVAVPEDPPVGTGETQRRHRHHRRRRQQDSESSANSNDNEDRRRRRAARRAERLRRMNSSPPSSSTISNLVGSNANAGTHLATDHEDTSEGAVHCFQDEFGNWHSYTFSQTSAGVSSVGLPAGGSTNNGSSTKKAAGVSRSSSSVSINSGLTVILDNPTMVFQPKTSTSDQPKTEELSEQLQTQTSQTSQISQISQRRPSRPLELNEYIPSPTVLRIRRRRSPLHQFAENLLERTRLASTTTASTATATVTGGVPGTDYVPTVGPPTSFPLHFERMTSENANVKLVPSTLPHSPRVKKFYHFRLAKCLPKFKIHFDRLALLAMLDRNVTWLENFVSVTLAFLVGIVAAKVLDQGHYQDLCMFLFCAVTASCQYSLLKSVQPDSASPTHGFNRVIVYSRAIYFIICGGVILILENVPDLSYEMRVFKDGLYVFVLFFPLIFVLGLLPQINTCAMYVLEQIDVHIFGGNATSSLVSSIYCVFRSLLAVFILIGFAYGGLTGKPNSNEHV